MQYLCTPRLNRKNERILFRRRENRVCPRILIRPGAKLVRYLHWSASQAPFPEQEEGVFNFTYVRAHVRVHTVELLACARMLMRMFVPPASWTSTSSTS